jgi:hypothetical protein
MGTVPGNVGALLGLVVGTLILIAPFSELMGGFGAGCFFAISRSFQSFTSVPAVLGAAARRRSPSVSQWGS